MYASLSVFPVPRIPLERARSLLFLLKTAINLFISFSRKERITFIASLFVFLISLILFAISIVQEKTVLSPVEGGEYVEGVVGQPMFINPIYAESNQADNDLSQLLFANMQAIAEKITVGSDGRTYDIRIKGDIVWQDNRPITTDDIIFTIRLIQDPNVSSPLAVAWKGVQAERISERELQIIAPVTYSYFETTLRSLQPIPKHIFENIPSANIRLSDYNIEPVGSGPYRFDSFEKRRDGFITQITVNKNDRYFGEKIYIDTIIVKFFQNEPSAVDALNEGDIDGIGITDPSAYKKVTVPHQTRAIEIPRYYAVFPNPFANSALTPMSMRTALNLATDNSAITKAIFGDTAVPITNPIPPFTQEEQGQHEYSLEKANALLDEYDWKMTDSGIREKDGKRLEFVLTVYPTPFLEATAKLLQEQWKLAGIDLRIFVASANDFNNAILKPRNYELLLFGNNYGKNIDPYSFWHSSQKLGPGLNLSIYANKDIDKLINVVRTDFDAESRSIGLREMRPIIMDDKPAIFLYSPYYLYVSNKSLKGFEDKTLGMPSERFAHINEWYIKTVRTLRK